MIFILLLINLIAICADAVSDSGISRLNNVNWFTWHVFKWLRLYIPQAIVAFLLHYSGLFYFTKSYIIGACTYIGIGWVLWLLVYKLNILGAQNEQDN